MSDAAARRYAQAAFDVAGEQRDVPGWQRELDRLVEVFGDPDVAEVFASPQLDDGRRIGIAISLAEGLRPEVVNFLKLLVLARRTELLPRTGEQFEELVAEAEGRVDLEVISARPLAPADEAAVRQELTRKAGRETRIELKVDPRIIGGLVIRRGDQVTDGSVRRRLRELRRQLVASGA
jgi:F-type H+-transporting ATPase subunit delta